MSLAHRQSRRKKPLRINIINSRSPSPGSYIDLTVDSPTPPPPAVQQQSRDSINNFAQNFSADNNTGHKNPNENLHDETITTDDADLRIGETIIIDDNTKSQEDYSNTINHKSVAAPTTTTTTTTTTTLSCPICLEELINSSNKAITTKCGHIFCESCIQNSLYSRKKCPICMASITLKSCIRLHL